MIEVTPQERDAIFRQDFIAFFLKAFEILYPGEKLILGCTSGDCRRPSQGETERSLRTVDGTSDRPE